MLTQRAPAIARFTRNDATRLVIAAGILVLALTAILGIDILPKDSLSVRVGDLAPRDIVAPRAIDFESTVQTEAARAAARAAVLPQYDFTTDKAIAIAAQGARDLEARVARIDAAFHSSLPEDSRKLLLQTAVPDLSKAAQATLEALTPSRWDAVRAEAARVLDGTLRTELRDTDVAIERTRLAGRMAGDLDEAERMLAADLISPLVVANSSFSAAATETARAAAAAAVAPIIVEVVQNEVIVRNGERLTATDLEKIEASGSASEPSTTRRSSAGSCSRPSWSASCWRGCGVSARPSGIATTCSS